MRFSKGKMIGRCDIIIAENLIEYLAIERAKIKRIGSVKAKVVTPEDLIIHKVTSLRPRDIDDLRGIFSRRKGKLDIKYIKYWLTKIAKANCEPMLIKLFENLIREEKKWQNWKISKSWR